MRCVPTGRWVCVCFVRGAGAGQGVIPKQGTCRELNGDQARRLQPTVMDRILHNNFFPVPLGVRPKSVDATRDENSMIPRQVFFF